MMVLSETFQTRLATIRAALQTITVAIDDLTDLPTLASADEASVIDLVMNRRDDITDFLADVETDLGVYVPHVMSGWDKALTSAQDAGDDQIHLHMEDAYLIVQRKRHPDHSVLHYGIAKDDNLVMNPASLSKAEIYASFLTNGYTVSDDSEWRSTLADAAPTWLGAWTACGEWNITHPATERCNQVQTDVNADSVHTTLFVDLVAGNLFQPGYHTAGQQIVRATSAIEEKDIPRWYQDHQLPFSFDAEWHLATR